MQYLIIFFFFFNDTATTEIYTLSLHDALPISIDDATVLDQEVVGHVILRGQGFVNEGNSTPVRRALSDRKSTRLNSSHLVISYAVFCLKKKNKKKNSCITR